MKGRALLIVSAGLLACRASETGDAGHETPPASSSEAVDTNAPAPVEPSPSADTLAWRVALDEALVRGIAPSGMDDGSYRIDAFVAVVVYEYLRRSGGAPTFEAIEAIEVEGDGAGPAGGYRVAALEEGSIWWRLGLREGDVVESINGVVLAPDRLVFALDGAENRVRVAVHRDDYVVTLSYHLVDSRGWSGLLAELGDGGRVALALPDPWDAPDAEPSRAQPAPAGATTPTQSHSGSTSRPSASSGTTRPAASPKPGSSANDSVRCENANRCTVSKAHFDALRAAPDRLLAQADVVPAIRNDVHSGYRLRTVRPDTTVARLGFRSGDKITHVNGYDLSNDTQAMQLYFVLPGSRVFKVRYERGTQQLMKTIELD